MGTRNKGKNARQKAAQARAKAAKLAAKRRRQRVAANKAKKAANKKTTKPGSNWRAQKKAAQKANTLNATRQRARQAAKRAKQLTAQINQQKDRRQANTSRKAAQPVINRITSIPKKQRTDQQQQKLQNSRKTVRHSNRVIASATPRNQARRGTGAFTRTNKAGKTVVICLLYTSPSPRD